MPHAPCWRYRSELPSHGKLGGNCYLLTLGSPDFPPVSSWNRWEIDTPNLLLELLSPLVPGVKKNWRVPSMGLHWGRPLETWAACSFLQQGQQKALPYSQKAPVPHQPISVALPDVHSAVCYRAREHMMPIAHPFPKNIHAPN